MFIIIITAKKNLKLLFLSEQVFPNYPMSNNSIHAVLQTKNLH